MTTCQPDDPETRPAVGAPGWTTSPARLGYDEGADEPALVAPARTALASRFGETAHYGRLDGAEIVYVAKVTPPSTDVRMTSVIGGRNPAHCTGIGNALLAYALLDRPSVARYVEQFGPLAVRTVHTITVAELGINCIAFPAFLGSSGSPAGAVSVAAVTHRTPVAALIAAVPEMRELLSALGVAPAPGQASSGWVAARHPPDPNERAFGDQLTTSRGLGLEQLAPAILGHVRRQPDLGADEELHRRAQNPAVRPPSSMIRAPLT
jgi:hypothetical protein